MPIGKLSRRTVVSGLSASALGLALTSGRLPAATEAATEASPGADDSTAFPVTIPHAFGETVITSRPERVVTLSWINQDVVIALGTIPVGMTHFTWGGDEDGYLPWTKAAIGDNPAPTRLVTTEGIPYEDIIALQPDVILGVYSGFNKDEYELLSQIAPTVAYPETPFATSWQDVTRIIGQVLGKSDEALRIIGDTESLLKNASQDFPQLVGKTFAYGNVDPASGFAIYTSIDPRVQLLSMLGMSPSPFVESLDTNDPVSPFYAAVSLERAHEIDGDILILWFTTQDEADAAVELPTMEGIEAFKNGAYAAIVGATNIMASSAPSPLSIPYIIDEYVPLLAAAADNVPS